MIEATSNLAGRILTWLRAGYPEGIPQGDYVALFGLLHRTLTETEVADFARQLMEAADDPSTPITRSEIEAVISQNVRQEACDEDIRRVAGHLAQGGWPLAAPLDSADAVG